MNNEYIKKKILVSIIYGGISFENSISIKSAINIIKNIDLNKFELIVIGININRSFHIETINSLKNIDRQINNLLKRKNNILKIKFNKTLSFYSNLIKKYIIPDVFFPITHGFFGEDGNIQSILNISNIPYVGSDFKSSCICANKDILKNILKINNFPIIPYILLNNDNILNFTFEKIKKIFGKYLFIKPSNQGSSIGITLVKTNEEFINGISRAFYFSKNIIVEPLIIGKEIECGVLNYFGKLIVSECCEIIKRKNFYSYKQKYFSKKTKIVIPARINNNLSEKIKKYSLSIFKLLECKDIARIDFIITKNKIFINEINTLPGFTENSVYLKLWNNYGLKPKKIISNLIYSSIKNDKYT